MTKLTQIIQAQITIVLNISEETIETPNGLSPLNQLQQTNVVKINHKPASLLQTNQLSTADKVNQLSKELKDLNRELSHAARFLCIGGKQRKPRLIKQLDDAINESQLSLFKDDS